MLNVIKVLNEKMVARECFINFVSKNIKTKCIQRILRISFFICQHDNKKFVSVCLYMSLKVIKCLY